MALTNKQISNWADDLYDSIRYDNSTDAGQPVGIVALSDGREIKLQILPDDYHDGLYGDYFGAVELDHKSCYTGYSRRPDGFDGAARKFDGNGRSNDTFWWQPPADLLNDKENLDKLFRHVKGYYNGDWWYVGLVVSIPGRPIDILTREVDREASVWGVENEDEDYLKETIKELIREAWNGNT